MAYSYNSRSPSLLSSDTSQDVALATPPEDSISAIAWSTGANLLAVASWDSKMRVYSLTNKLSGELGVIIDFEKPVLSCHWSPNGKQVVGAGADRTARLLDLGSSRAAPMQVAAHDLPIASVRFFEGPSHSPMIVTGSWDKSVRIWDLRVATPVVTLDVKNKVNSMDTQKGVLMVATADLGYQAIHLQNPISIFQQPTLELKHNAKVVRCFPNGKGFVAGGLEARCSVYWLNDSIGPSRKSFSFKCHRSPPKDNNVDCYAVNAVTFHPSQGTFCSGGSDGTMNIWDKDAKVRISTFSNVGGPVTATAFNQDGKLLAYAVSYDWSKGFAYNTPQTVNKIMIHSVKDAEVKAKAPRR